MLPRRVIGARKLAHDRCTTLSRLIGIFGGYNGRKILGIITITSLLLFTGNKCGSRTDRLNERTCSPRVDDSSVIAVDRPLKIPTSRCFAIMQP